MSEEMMKVNMHEDGDRDMIEIDKEEYEARKLMDKERREKLNIN